MASHSLPVSLPHTIKRERSAGAAKTHGPGIVIAALVALLILLSWLHLIQALEIAGTVRDMQARTVELERIERSNNQLRIEISEALSPVHLAESAEQMGFRASEPVYVLFPPGLVEPAQQGHTGGSGVLDGPQNWTEDKRTLWQYATGQLETLLEVEAAP